VLFFRLEEGLKMCFGIIKKTAFQVEMYKKVFQNHPLHSTKPFWHKLSYLLKKSGYQYKKMDFLVKKSKSLKKTKI